MLFLDSSEPDEVRDIFRWGVVRGVTTNPLILARTKTIELEPRIRHILAASEGPVSVQLLSEHESGMLEEADRYRGWAPERIVVAPSSFPSSAAGCATWAMTCAPSSRTRALSSIARGSGRVSSWVRSGT